MCNISTGFITGDFKFEYVVKVVSAEVLHYEIPLSHLHTINMLEDMNITAMHWSYLCNTRSSFLLLMGYFF